MAETTSVTGTLLSLLGGVSPFIEQQCPLVDLRELFVRSIKDDRRLINRFETQSSNPVPHIWCVFWRSCVHLKPCLDKESNNRDKCPLVFRHKGLQQQFAFRHYAVKHFWTHPLLNVAPNIKVDWGAAQMCMSFIGLLCTESVLNV